MSLTSLLDTDERFREIVKEHLPNRELFRTNTGDKAFSTKYRLLVPNTLPGRYYSTLVGTAFDYAARFITARYASGNCGEEDEITSSAISNLNSIHGFSYVKRMIEKKDGVTYQKLYDRYVKAIAFVKTYFKRPDLDHSILAGPCCFLARMEQIYRSGGIMPGAGYESLLENEPKEVYTDLKRLCDVFFETFITSGIVHGGSTVVFNPTFGKESTLLGGADADIYIDGVLYDFKATKESRYRWQEVAQIYVYYLLHELNVMTELGLCTEADYEKKAQSQHMIAGDIDKITLYKARFGVIESLDVSLIEGKLETQSKLSKYMRANRK